MRVDMFLGHDFVIVSLFLEVNQMVSKFMKQDNVQSLHACADILDGSLSPCMTSLHTCARLLILCEMYHRTRQDMNKYLFVNRHGVRQG